MRPSRRLGGIAALAISAALALSGCSDTPAPENTAEGTASGGTLTLSVPIAPAGFDPAGADWGAQSPYWQAAYDTLLRATADGELEPWLAAEWSYNEDGTVLTLQLREDVTFTDGTSLTGDVVVENLTRFRDGTAPNASYLAGVTSIEAPDDHTVVLTLDAPNPALLNALSRDAGLIASAERLADGSLTTDPEGSGPYILDTSATVTGSTYTYTKNPEYWNPEVQHYDELVIKVLFDDASVVNAIKAGEVDAAPLGTSASIAEVEAAGWTSTSNEVNWAGINFIDRTGQLNPALGDVRVRQAINYALDREALLQAIEGGYGTVTEQIFPASATAYDASLDTHYAYDPDKAKQLLADAGYADGFTLSMPSTTIFGTAVFPLLQQQLAEVGISVEYTDPGQNLLPDVLSGKYGAVWFAIDQPLTEWQLINYVVSPAAGWNPLHTSDSAVDDLMTKVQNGDSDAAKELNTYLVEQAWFAPAYRLQNNFATDADTAVVLMPDNKYPSLYDITPKQ